MRAIRRNHKRNYFGYARYRYCVGLIHCLCIGQYHRSQSDANDISCSVVLNSGVIGVTSAAFILNEARSTADMVGVAVIALVLLLVQLA